MEIEMTIHKGPPGPPNKPPSYVPPRYVPFDPHPWVMSSEQMIWHLTEGGCDYVWVIKVHHRVYRDVLEPRSPVCQHCMDKYKKYKAEG
jgi:hypothetical protein